MVGRRKNPKGAGEPKLKDSPKLQEPGSKNPLMPIIGPPFRLKEFNKLVFNNRLKAGNSRQQNEDIASRMLARQQTAQVRYLLLLFQIGAEVERAWHRLEQEQVLNIDELRNYIEFTRHRAMKAAGKSKNLPRGDTKISTDHKMFMWVEILKDSHLLLQAHIEDFVSSCHLSMAPHYEDVMRK